MSTTTTGTTSTTNTSSNNNDGDELVKLNVGGKHFSTYKSTLMTYPDTMLARMFSTSAGIAKKGPEGEYFLDRNPDLFSIILEFYRNKALIVPKSTPLEALYNELQYFGIDYEEEDIQIAGEPTHLPMECYLSVAHAYKALPTKGHLLGTVVMGLPRIGDEDDSDDEEYEEDEVEEEENGDGKNRKKPITKLEVQTNKAFQKLSQKPQVRWSKTPLKYEIDYDFSEPEDESKVAIPNLLDDEGDSSPTKKKAKIDHSKEDSQPHKKYVNVAVLEKIKDSLSDIAQDTYFCCGGELTKFHKVKLVMQPLPNSNADDTLGPVSTKKDKSSNKVNCGLVENLNYNLIKSLCTTASFGDLKTTQTKIDPNVRASLECKAKRFTLNLQHQFYNVEEYFRTKLNHNKNVEFKPYKLNIYEPGEFFNSQMYIPMKHKMVGCLVLCLPSEHEGGELIVSHNGISHTFDFAKKSANNTVVQWAAFLSDCMHEMKPVTRGTRVTVTFLVMEVDLPVFAVDRNAFWKFFCGPVDPVMNSGKLDELVALMNKLHPSIVKIGLFLSCKYTTTAISMETLKERDKLLVEKLAAKFNWHLIPVIYNEFISEYEGEYAYENSENAICNGDVYAFSTDDLKYLNRKGPKPQHKFSRVPFVVGRVKGNLLVHKFAEGGEYESRPAQCDSVYFHAAVILTRK